MKSIRTIFFAASLLCASQYSIPESHQAVKLDHPLLRSLDSAGYFDHGLLDILEVRLKVRDLLSGKFTVSGIELSIETTAGHELPILIKHPEIIFGATFIVIDPAYVKLHDFVDASCRENVDNYLESVAQLKLLDRQKIVSMNGVFTGSYAIHPLSQKQIPIYIADYNNDRFDIRTQHTHLAIPAHDRRDFQFAKTHNLPIELVRVPTQAMIDSGKEDAPVMKNNSLAEAYLETTNQYILTNSGDFSGKTVEVARQEITEALQGSAISTTLQYHFNKKNYSIHELVTVESFIHNPSQNIPEATRKAAIEQLTILLNYMQDDFLAIVEQFLSSIGKPTVKNLMIELIEDSTKKRDNKKSYLLNWSKFEGRNSERENFKRDIVTISQFYAFCNDLANFLGDFASSCPHALNAINKLMH